MHQSVCSSPTLYLKGIGKKYIKINIDNSEFLLSDQTEKQLTVRDINSERKNSKTFSFDDIFPSETPQTAIYEATTKHLTK